MEATVDEHIANLRALATHPLNRNLRSATNGNLETFRSERNRWVAVPGLVDALRATFYPDYDHQRAQNAARRERWRPNHQPAPADPKFEAERRRLGLSGRDLGAYIDREMASVCTRAAQQGRRPADFVDSDSLSLFTRSLLSFHARNDWQPLFAQFPVCARELNVGTRIDELCINSQGQLIVLELKYGYDTYREYGNSRMSDPLGDCLNSPQNQHALQCGIPCLMLQRYYGVTVAGAFTVYITDGEVYAVAVPDWFWARADEIWAEFSDRMRRKV